MSRTYRKYPRSFEKIHGQYLDYDNPEHKAIEKEYLKSIGANKFSAPSFEWVEFFDLKSRDRKPWNKPPKWFKQDKRRKERHRDKQDLHCGKDPRHWPKSDQWDWT